MFPLGNLLDLLEVKRGLTSKTSRLEEIIDLYSPDDYPPDVVLINRYECVINCSVSKTLMSGWVL